MLKKFEDNAKSTMDKLLKQVRTSVNDDIIKKKYFKARAIYNEIADKTGDESPSKKAERATVERAIKNKTKAEVIKCFRGANNMDDIKQNIKKL